MRRNIKVALASSAALMIGTIAVLVPGATTANAATDFIVWNGPKGSTEDCWLYAHAHGDSLRVWCSAGKTPQAWNWTDVHQITDSILGTVTVGELQLTGTNLCANGDPSTQGVYVDSCIAGDSNELFYPQKQDSKGDYGYINVALANDGYISFLTPSEVNPQSGDDLILYVPSTNMGTFYPDELWWVAVL